MNYKLKIAAIGVLSLATACASTTEGGALLSEEPGFGAGYGDGCATAQETTKSFSTKRTRDDYQFENDRAYRAGWRQGFLQCGETPHPVGDDGGRILGDEERF